MFYENLERPKPFFTNNLQHLFKNIFKHFICLRNQKRAKIKVQNYFEKIGGKITLKEKVN